MQRRDSFFRHVISESPVGPGGTGSTVLCETEAMELVFLCIFTYEMNNPEIAFRLCSVEIPG